MHPRHGFYAVGLMTAIIVIGIISILICLIISSNRKSDAILAETNEKLTVMHVDFRDDIVVDDSTGIVYIQGYRVLSPYYSPNGKICKYVDGKLVEVED